MSIPLKEPAVDGGNLAELVGSLRYFATHSIYVYIYIYTQRIYGEATGKQDRHGAAIYPKLIVYWEFSFSWSSGAGLLKRVCCAFPHTTTEP